MYGRSIRYFRAMKMLTIDALAEQTGITSELLNQYEQDECNPSKENFEKLVDALDITYGDIARYQNGDLTFKFGEYEKFANLSVVQLTYIQEYVEEYFTRFLTVTEFFDEEVLPPIPPVHSIQLSSNREQNAALLRRFLGLPTCGPALALVRKLEERGFLVCECKINTDRFSGMNGIVNGRPFIVINSNMSPERNRATLIHELAHLMFIWPADMNSNAVETMATSVSEAFLFPEADVTRKFDSFREEITSDVISIAKEYGTSTMMLVRRAEICGIISKATALKFYCVVSNMGWRKMEPSRIAAEHPMLFEQLVYRAVDEQEISMQRGVELLHYAFNDEMAKRQLGDG